MRVLLATNNTGKRDRYTRLLARALPDVDLQTPTDLGVEAIDVEETGTTLAENAELKVRAYEGKTDLPVLANDTGFYVEGEGFVLAPKREALGETAAHHLTDQELYEKMMFFWQGIARKHGGTVDAAWVDVFALLKPDGTVKHAESRREVVLTDQVFGDAHKNFPVRALYISKATNKPVVHHAKEDELVELQPITDALTTLLS